MQIQLFSENSLFGKILFIAAADKLAGLGVFFGKRSNFYADIFCLFRSKLKGVARKIHYALVVEKFEVFHLALIVKLQSNRFIEFLSSNKVGDFDE